MKQEKSKTPQTAFAQAAGFIKNNKLQTAFIAAPVLLVTTGLTTPLLAAVTGASILIKALSFGLMVGSCAMVAKTSDALVDNSSAIGKKKGISPIVLGLGLGVLTSMPELFVSLRAITVGASGISIGNIVGSNIANILLILGATAAFSGIQKGKGLVWKFNNKAMLGASVLFTGLLATNSLTLLPGLVLFGLTAAYLGRNYVLSKKDGAPPKKEEDHKDPYHPHNMPTWFNSAWALAGLGGLIASAGLLVGSASVFAGNLGVPEALVGALAVAVGTSVPELMVNIKAARKGETDMAVGNILGSNVFNILVVGGALAAGGALLGAGAPVPPDFMPTNPMGHLNFWSLLGSAGLLGYLLKKNDGGLKRSHGFGMAGLYIAFAATSMWLGRGKRQETTPAQSKDLNAPVSATQTIEPQKPVPPPGLSFVS